MTATRATYGSGASKSCATNPKRSRSLLRGNTHRQHARRQPESRRLSQASSRIARGHYRSTEGRPDDFIAWLEQMAPGKSGPSGVGKENYTWYEQNVHLVPYSWDDQVVLLRCELERAQAAFAP